MATSISNPASFSSVRTAFNAEGYGISTSFYAYRQGGGIVPATSGFDAIGAGTSGDPLRLSQFSGFSVPSPITFFPAGGESVGTAETVGDIGSTFAQVQINCSQNATWTYSGGGAGAGVSISSGGVSTVITFSLSTDFNPRDVSWALSATSGGITRYWDVYLEVQGYA